MVGIQECIRFTFLPSGTSLLQSGEAQQGESVLGLLDEKAIAAWRETGEAQEAEKSN